MPTRILREGILRSKIVNRLDWGAEIFYRRLMSIVDDYGLFESDPDLLRAYLYPLKLDRVSTADIVKWMRCVAEAGLVSEYEAQGKDYGAIERFDQRTDTAPKYPLPPWMKLQIGGEKRKTYRAIDARIMRNPGDPSGTPGNSGELRGNPAVGGDEDEDEDGDEDEGDKSRARGRKKTFSLDPVSVLPDEMQSEFRRWLVIWAHNHNGGVDMHPAQIEGQVRRLLGLPENIRLEAIKRACDGGWKNINDIRESVGSPTDSTIILTAENRI